MKLSIRSILLGALAGVLGLLIGHQSLIELFHALGIVTFRGYRLDPVGPLSLPFVVNAAFWCALWGLLMALVWPLLPGRHAALKGLIFGLVFVQALGNWVLVPLFKGTPFFHGFDIRWMAITACFQAGFGVASGLAYRFLRG
jgi:hypothetical protein